MPHKYVDWFSVRPPRTNSLDNLNKLVIACDKLGATHPGGRQTLYAVAKLADVAYQQAQRLTTDRPGFVLVKHKGETRGIYWDRNTFGPKYPANYVDHTKTRVLSEYDITPEESLGEKAVSARQIESMVDSATGKVVPILFEAQPVEGAKSVEYRVIFNVNEQATLEDYLEPLKAIGQELTDGTDLRINLNNLMRLELALIHNERISDA